MSKISFECHSCGQNYKVEMNLGGKSAKCVKCGADMRIPRIEPDTLAPMIVPESTPAPKPQAKAAPTRVLSKEEMKRMMQGGTLASAAPPQVAPPMAPPPMAAPPMAGNLPQRRVSSRSGASSRRMPVAGGAMNRNAPGQFDPHHPMPAPRKKKSNGPMIALTIGLVVVAAGAMVAAFMLAGNNADAGNDSAAVNNTPSVADNTPNPEEERQKKLNEDKDWLERNINSFLSNLSNTSDYGELWARYHQLKEKSDIAPELANVRKTKLDELAEFLRTSCKNRTEQNYLGTHFEVSMALKEDGYENFAKDIANFVMRDSQIMLPKDEKQLAQYRAMAELAGWKVMVNPLEDPRLQKDYIDHFPQAGSIASIMRDMDQAFGQKGYCPPERMQDVENLAKELLDEVKAVEAQQEQDGFAEYALKSFVQFKSKYQKLYEKKITPGSTWQYKYANPFIYFVEVPPGEVLEDVVEGMKLKERILLDLVAYFNKNYRERWGLERKYPFSEPNAEERAKWPLEIVVLSSEDAYQQYQVVTSGGVSPGARAHYEPDNYRVITWDDKGAATDPEAEWFNKSVLIHESWHFLSGTHMDSRFDKKWLYKPNRQDPEGRYFPYPGYSSILIQEGLTDHIAGFIEENGHFDFGHTNHLRMKTYQDFCKRITEAWKKGTLDAEKNGDEYRGRRKWKEGLHAGPYDVRSMVQVIAYMYSNGIVRNYMVDDLGLRGPEVFQSSQNGTFLIYCAGSSFANFCQYHENGKYREMFDEWCKRDYLGLIDKYKLRPDECAEKEWKENPGLLEFMKLFEIDSVDSPRWDELSDEWMDYAMKVKVIDVGKSVGEPEVDPKTPSGGGGNSGIMKSIVENYQRFIDDPTAWYGPEGEAFRRNMEAKPTRGPEVDEALAMERNANPAFFIRAMLELDLTSFDRFTEAFYAAIDSVPLSQRHPQPKAPETQLKDGDAPSQLETVGVNGLHGIVSNEDE